MGPPFCRLRAEALKLLAQRLQPDILAVSGDLVQWSGDRQAWADVGDYLRSFDLPLAVRPGNHDIARLHLGRRLSNPLRFFRTHVHQHGDHIQHHKGISIAAIATPKRRCLELGVLSPKQCTTLKDELQQEPKNLKVVVMHHGLKQLGPPIRRTAVWGAGYLRKLFEKLKVDLVLTGHNHFPWVEELGTSRPFLWCQTGTATSRRIRPFTQETNVVSLIGFNDSMISVQHFHYDAPKKTFIAQPSQSFARNLSE